MWFWLNFFFLVVNCRMPKLIVLLTAVFCLFVFVSLPPPTPTPALEVPHWDFEQSLVCGRFCPMEWMPLLSACCENQLVPLFFICFCWPFRFVHDSGPLCVDQWVPIHMVQPFNKFNVPCWLPLICFLKCLILIDRIVVHYDGVQCNISIYNCNL